MTLTDVDAETLEESTARLRERGGDVRSVVLDVTDETAVRGAMADVAQAQGGVDVVFANAGISTGPGIDDPAGRVEGFNRASFDRVRAVNLDGVFFTVQAAAGVMRPQRAGRIDITASIAGSGPSPRFVDYGYMVAKAAVLSLCAPGGARPRGRQRARQRDRPRAVRGDAHRRARSRAARDRPRARADSVPLGRMGDPEELKGPRPAARLARLELHDRRGLRHRRRSAGREQVTTQGAAAAAP